MRRRLFYIVAILALVLGSVTPAMAAPVEARLSGLQPGQQVTYTQKIPVKVVFVGYDRSSIDLQAFLGQLPATYEPIVRYPAFYGLTGRDMGLHFNFDYRVSFTGRSFANRFFNYLKSIGTPGDLTDYQTAYNDQVNNVLDVTGPVMYIDAPSVENWLAHNVPFANPKAYTIVFVNWYSRPDFQFHLYSKTDVVDPDTGYNFGEQRDTRKVIAWGGTKSRTWFYDLSAGPEAWTDNWNVDDPDLDGNGAEDYRMPPIWEYAANGYRDPSALSTDLAKVARFVGINLLFTSSPLYDPLVTAPGPGGDKIVHINMMEDDPASLGTDWIDTTFAQKQLTSFEPYYRWQTNLVDYNPIEPDVQRALRIWAELLPEADCWNAFGDPFAELFCYFDARRDTYIPPYDPADYVAGIYAFNTTAASLGPEFGLLGYADDNWVDGTQSYVFAFDAAEYRTLGYGFTTTVIHEGGHHIGLSHPHDGYDSEMGIDYGPGDEFYFAWSGDESNTIMHYLDLTDEFGRFDRDNMYRYEMAGYLNWSNALLGQIRADPDAHRVRGLVAQAQKDADIALKAFRGWNYLLAARRAHHAYIQLAIAADRLGIPTPTAQTLRVAPASIPPHQGDPIRFPDN
jgi:hypothetical protein